MNSKITSPVEWNWSEDTITISDCSTSSYSITIPNGGASGSSYTIGNYSYGTTAVNWSNDITGSTLKVNGDADFDGDIKVKGKSLTEFMETLEKRLAILQPDPAKLEKFEALKKAYDHYKLLEALCQEDDDRK